MNISGISFFFYLILLSHFRFPQCYHPCSINILYLRLPSIPSISHSPLPEDGIPDSPLSKHTSSGESLVCFVSKFYFRINLLKTIKITRIIRRTCQIITRKESHRDKKKTDNGRDASDTMEREILDLKLFEEHCYLLTE